jgi:hypothetical protein
MQGRGGLRARIVTDGTLRVSRCDQPAPDRVDSPDVEALSPQDS